MIDDAADFVKTAVEGGGDPTALLAGFLTAKFWPRGDWDYKSKYQPGTQDYANATVFGNFAFGAVMQSLGASLFVTQNSAGTAQILIHLAGGAGGQGIPFLSYPFGDQPADARDVQRGWDYERVVNTVYCK